MSPLSRKAHSVRFEDESERVAAATALEWSDVAEERRAEARSTRVNAALELGTLGLPASLEPPPPFDQYAEKPCVVGMNG